MATLTADELDELSTQCCRKLKAANQPIDYDRRMINAGFQAMEDWYESNKASAAQAINAATSPYGYTFSNEYKKYLFMYWMLQKFRREEAS